MEFICPEYKTIKSQITRYKNKQLPPDVTKFDEIPDESKYYKTVWNKNLMKFKNTNLIIFQSSFQAKLFMKYNKDVFTEDIIFIIPKYSYQEFITRTYIKYLNNFYPFSI